MRKSFRSKFNLIATQRKLILEQEKLIANLEENIKLLKKIKSRYKKQVSNQYDTIVILQRSVRELENKNK